MTIESIIEKMNHGASIRIDFKQKTCKVNGKLISIDSVERSDIGEVLCEIERLYDNYYTSKPTEYDRLKSYFKAKSFEELDDFELTIGEARPIAMARLELYVLQQLLSGNLYWNWGKKWFWQNVNNKNLILLKEWF